MKCRHLLIVLFLSFIAGCSTRAESSIPCQLPDPEIELKLRSILPKGWTLLTEENTFTLVREEKVWVYEHINWDATDRRPFEEQVKENGTEEKFQIKLRFVPRLTDSEYQQLKTLREPYELMFKHGLSLYTWGYVISELYKHPVPTYVTDNYSVFAEKSNDYPSQIYPESALPECSQVLAAIDGLFPRYQKRTESYDF